MTALHLTYGDTIILDYTENNSEPLVIETLAPIRLPPFLISTTVPTTLTISMLWAVASFALAEPSTQR